MNLLNRHTCWFIFISHAEFCIVCMPHLPYFYYMHTPKFLRNHMILTSARNNENVETNSDFPNKLLYGICIKNHQANPQIFLFAIRIICFCKKTKQKYDCITFDMHIFQCALNISNSVLRMYRKSTWFLLQLG